MMEIVYSELANAVYIYLLSEEYQKEGAATDTVHLIDYPNVFLDFTKDGKLLGIDIKNASEMIDIEYLKKLEFKEIDKKRKI